MLLFEMKLGSGWQPNKQGVGWRATDLTDFSMGPFRPLPPSLSTVMDM